MPPTLRPFWVLGAGACVVSAAMLLSRGGGTSEAGAMAAAHPMAISGEPLVASGSANVPVSMPVSVSGPSAAPPPTSFVGDAAFAGQIDLDHATLVGDHYEVALPGNRTAILTLDPQIQAAAEKTLAHAKAPTGAIAVVATDGRVLALAGRRGKDPKKGGPDGTPDWHLALDASAPAASVFKIVSAAALLEAGVTPDTKVCFHGGLRSLNESNLEDGKHDGRCEDLTYAVAFSQNAIIAKLAHQHLEPKTLGEMAKRLGVDGPLPASALAGQAGDLTIPADNGLELARTAAGFTGVHLSALGGALLADAIATKGDAVTPRIVDAIVDNGRRTDVTPVAPRRAIAADVAAQIGHMMEATCARGTAARAFKRGGELSGGVRVAGKTGTLAGAAPYNLEYSWFVGYAPADKPSISIAVVLGNADSWWMKGHQAARQVLATALAKAGPIADK